MPIRIHRCSCVCGGQRATSGASPVTVHLLKEGEEGEGRRDQSGGREEESKAGEESKKGKGDGKRKNRGRKRGGSESFSVFYHFVGGVRFINLLKSHG